MLIVIDNGTIVWRQAARWLPVSPSEKFRLLVQEGVEVLICGGLTEACENMLHESGIEFVPWVRGEVEDVLRKFMQGELRTDAPQQNDKISSRGGRATNADPEGP